MDYVVLVKGLLPPVLIGLSLVGAGGNRMLPLAIALGRGAAFLLLKGWPALPHELWSRPNGTQWLLWSLLGVGLVGSLAHWRCLPVRLGSVAVALTAAFGVWLILGKLGSREDLQWALPHIGTSGAAVILLVLAGARLAARTESSSLMPVVGLVVLSADAAILTLSGSALYGQLCGSCAAVLGAAIATVLWRGPLRVEEADGAVFGAVHGVFLVAGVHLSYLTWPAASLAAVALLAPLPIVKKRGSPRMLAALVLTILPAGGAIALSLR